MAFGQTPQPQYEQPLPMTPQEQALMAAQTQASQNQATQDTGLFMQQEQDMENSRQFYLGYEDELDQLIHNWKGERKEGDGWVKDSAGNRIMSDQAIATVKTMLNSFLIRAVRLGNYEPKLVSTYAYQARKHISKWLHTAGWLKYGIELEYLNLISFQCGQLVHAALSWAQNGGGRHFMTTTNRTIENVSHVLSQPTAQPTGAQRNRFLKIPKLPKPW